MLLFPLKIPLTEGVFQPNLAYPALARFPLVGPHLAPGFFHLPGQSNGMSLCLQIFWSVFQFAGIPQTPELICLPPFDDFRSDMLCQKRRCFKEKTGLFSL
jgi:hypothetical protein